jgi:hypothetical protein
MVDPLEECKQQIVTYPAPEKARGQMQGIDSQMEEMQRASKHQCRQIFATQLPFRKLVCSIHLRCRAYQALSKCLPDRPQRSNAVLDVLKVGIEEPRLLSKDQCLDGAEACRHQLCALKGQAGGLRQVHLQDCLIRATDAKNNTKQRGILRTIEREERKSMWRQTNRALDNPSLGAIPFVQRMEGGRVVDVMETTTMNTEIQVVTERWFDLLMSAPITVSLLWEKIGFLSDTDFAWSLLNGEVHMPPYVNNITTIIIEEIQ